MLPLNLFFTEEGAEGHNGSGEEEQRLRGIPEMHPRAPTGSLQGLRGPEREFPLRMRSVGHNSSGEKGQRVLPEMYPRAPTGNLQGLRGPEREFPLRMRSVMAPRCRRLTRPPVRFM